jgi:SAM-dependent methyltransferase
MPRGMILAWRAGCGAAVAALVLALMSSGPSAQPRMKKNPTLIYVPSPQSIVDKMLEVAKVTADDFVIDLGSGDGRIPITAAKRYGARGLGVDISSRLVAEARANAKAEGVADRVEFRQQDLFKTSVRDATVVALYLFVWANERLRPRLIGELRPGSRIVAHDFPIGDEWKPDVVEDFENRTVYLWYVPAQVGGRWDVTGGDTPFTLDLRQQFQMVRGTATVNGRAVPLRNTSLRGDEFDFTVELANGRPTTFRGRVSGDSIAPRANTEPAGWSATRTSGGPRPEVVLRRRG